MYKTHFKSGDSIMIALYKKFAIYKKFANKQTTRKNLAKRITSIMKPTHIIHALKNNRKHYDKSSH